MTTKTTVEILREARAILETNGLHKGNFVDPGALEDDVPVEECPVCVYGALNLASGRDVDYTGDLGAAELLVAEVLGVGDGNGLAVADWNDLPSTTLIDVLRLLDRSIVRAELAEAVPLLSNEEVVWLAESLKDGAR